MDEMIKKAIKALQESNCNEIELTDESGMKVRVVKFTPIPQVWTSWPYTYAVQYPPQP